MDRQNIWEIIMGIVLLGGFPIFLVWLLKHDKKNQIPIPIPIPEKKKELTHIKTITINDMEPNKPITPIFINYYPVNSKIEPKKKEIIGLKMEAITYFKDIVKTQSIRNGDYTIKEVIGKGSYYIVNRTKKKYYKHGPYMSGMGDHLIGKGLRQIGIDFKYGDRIDIFLLPNISEEDDGEMDIYLKNTYNMLEKEWETYVWESS